MDPVFHFCVSLLCSCWFSPFSSSPWLLQNMGVFRTRKYFKDSQTVNTVQSFAAIKGETSGLFFFEQARGKGISPDTTW